MKNSEIAIILQAAGNSSRFGSNKLLKIMDSGRPMICGILDAARSQDPCRRILVTQYDEVAAMAPDFRIVMNHHPELGISRSMQLGIEAAGDADAYMFCVCDQPWVSASTLKKLIDAYKSGTHGIVSLAWKGKMCNPKIFSSRYRDELMNLRGDTGGRQIISSHTDDLLLVEADSEKETLDIDRPVRLWNYKGSQSSISEALQLRIPEHAVISITGSGGKTSLLTAWARELAASGRRTVITTTTHMQHPDHTKDESSDPYRDIRVIYAVQSDEPDPGFSAVLDSALKGIGPVMVVSPDPVNPAKVMAPPQWVPDHLYRSADVILIEADGSRRLPLKWPAPWEPVVPEETDITVCVAGLSALGRPVSEVMYRADDLPESLKRDTVDETLISAVLASTDGGQKGAQGEYRVYLNQADNEDLLKAASGLQKILGVYGIQSAWGTFV